MKIVIAGGAGYLGRILLEALTSSGHQVRVLGRGGGDAVVPWDGQTLGPWVREIDGADVVINLAGRSVDCRYTVNNLREMMDSRVFSTRIIGKAIEEARNPPKVWLQMSTATIYAHRFDAANDESSGVLGGEEPDAPSYWRYSIEIARAWERELEAASTPRTRKVALRTAMVMSTAPGGVFPILLRLTRLGLGGSFGAGHQYISWIHQTDFIRAIEFLIQQDDLSGPVNLAAPEPLPQREFMAILRRQWGIRFGMPASAWMLEAGAFVMRTDTELLLKSRRVIPGHLLNAGFDFDYPSWIKAAAELVNRTRDRRSAAA